MSDIQTMQEMITGLRQKRKNLQADEAVFLKLSGINEEIEKASQENAEFHEKLTEAKKRRDDAKKKKAAAVSETTSDIAQKMNEALPFGYAFFSYAEDDDGKRDMEIGWTVDDKSTPYNGLSGGEKQIFDAALAHVLDADIIVVEAAELDVENLQKTLDELSKLDKQILINTCHPLVGINVPENFKVVGV